MEIASNGEMVPMVIAMIHILPSDLCGDVRRRV